MSAKVTVRAVESIDVEDLKFDKLYKTSNGVTRAVLKYKGGPLYIRGPSVTLGQDVCKSGHHYYISLDCDETRPKQAQLARLIRSIDNFAVAEVFQDVDHWYPESKNLSLTQLEREYNPSVKSSLLTGRSGLKLKCSESSTEFYDGDGDLVPFSLLKMGYTAVPILLIDSVYKNDTQMWLEIGVPQLKVTIPESVIKSCQLVDVVDDESSDNDTIEQDPEFY